MRGFELLEQRQLLTLLGVMPDFPQVAFDFDGTAAYSAPTQAFDLDATPIAFQRTESSDPAFFFGTQDIQIHIRLGENGELLGGVNGDDLTLSGEVDVDGDFIPDVSGVLLTGEIVAFGFHDSGGPNDQYDFRFVPTGGALKSDYPFFDGKDVGVIVDSEGSTFTDSFAVNFSGGAKGTLGPIEPISTVEAEIDIEKYVKEACGGEGLTPGFWKQCQHFKHWKGYRPSNSYEAVFGVNDPGSPTLLEALQRGGGGYKALGRHAVAALLNAANPNVSYAFTVDQIKAMVQQAYVTGQYEAVKDQLAAENERGADLDDDGCDCPSGYGDDADEPTGPRFDVGQRVQFTYVVTNPGEAPLADVTVVDDNGTPDDDGDDFSPIAVQSGGFNAGDVNQDGLLDAGEEWLYTSTITIACGTPRGQHSNNATVTGTSPTGDDVSDQDAAYWYVGRPDKDCHKNCHWDCHWDFHWNFSRHDSCKHDKRSDADFHRKGKATDCVFAAKHDHWTHDFFHGKSGWKCGW